MENLVNKIIDIDKNADDKVLEAQNRKNQVIAEVELKKKDLIEEINKHADAKLKNFEQSQLEEINELIKKVDKNEEKCLAELNKFYDYHHDKWIDNIFKNVLSD